MSNLDALAIRLVKEGPHKILPTPRLVQAMFNGQYILKTTKAVLVWEIPFYPQIYVPLEALESKNVREGNAITTPDGQSVAKRLTISINEKIIDQAFVFETNLSGQAASLNGLVKIEFSAVDQWFEEATPIFVHPKDPFKRVDILASTRHVRVKIDGVLIADATSSMHLYETGLPPRYYLPLTSIDARYLRPSDTKTRCPYKGEAEYYSVEVEGKLHKDIVWYYRHPTLESIKVEGLCCFYNEKVDIELDGESLERPETHFSKVKPGDKPPGS